MDLSRRRFGAVSSLLGLEYEEIADLAVHQVFLLEISARDFGGNEEVGGASAVEVEGVGDVPMGRRAGVEGLAELGQGAGGGDADPPAMPAVVEEDGAHGRLGGFKSADGL